MENGVKNGFGTEYVANARKNRTMRSKLVPGAGILSTKFLLERPSRLVSNNGPLTRHFYYCHSRTFKSASEFRC